MKKTLGLVFALGMATLGIAGSATYSLEIRETASVAGSTLKPGSYTVSVDGNMATIKSGKTSVQVPVKVESEPQKFRANSVRYEHIGDAYRIKEIGIGGTATKLVVEGGSGEAAN